MKIASASLELAAHRSAYQHQAISESLRVWVGDRRPDFEGDGLAPRDSGRVTLSDGAREAHAKEANAVEENLDAAEHDPVLGLIRQLLARLTGEDVRVFNPRALCCKAPEDTTDSAPPATSPSTPARAGFGVEYDYHASRTEFEQTDFQASGLVQTADGRQIRFELSLTMTRAYHEESTLSLRLGDARQKSDPLVINFAGNSAELTGSRFAFDLDANGSASEQVHFATGASGFLAFDRNGDGVINDGSELFGPRSGNGFAELAQFDADANGWIDENDAVWNQLTVWSKDESGSDTLRTLAQADVGAISVARIATPFDIRDASNAERASVRTSGIYLQESGGAGSVQQVDLTI